MRSWWKTVCYGLCAAAVAATAAALLAMRAHTDRGETSPPGLAGLGLAFDAAEIEFKALTPLLSMDAEDRARGILRQRLVVCAMIMLHCANNGAVVTREQPYDGFEQRPVTSTWIRPYLDQVSQYPEWEDRHALVVGILTKTSG